MQYKSATTLYIVIRIRHLCPHHATNEYAGLSYSSLGVRYVLSGKMDGKIQKFSGDDPTGKTITFVFFREFVRLFKSFVSS